MKKKQKIILIFSIILIIGIICVIRYFKWKEIIEYKTIECPSLTANAPEIGVLLRNLDNA